jgi:hypothetical protein
MNASVFFRCGSARVRKHTLLSLLSHYMTDGLSTIAYPQACVTLMTRESNAQMTLWTLLVRSAEFLATDP